MKMDKSDTDQQLHWHPAFLQAIQLELIEFREYLEFRYEHNLTFEPLRIDLLIIKKPKELFIDKNIARVFRSDNILEYKSPEDYLSVKDFWKVYAYAYLYASITQGVELSDITLTFIDSRHPRKLLHYLTEVRGYTVEETSPGIYGVTGDYLPIQIIETKKLSEKENRWLESLRGGLKESSLSVIFEEGKKLAREINIDAYLDIILRANKKTFMEVYKMTAPTLEEILTEVGLVPKWMEQGQEKTARNLLARSMPIEDIAQVTELPIEKVRSLAAAG